MAVVNRLPGDHYTVTEAAEMLGLSKSTLRRWYRNSATNGLKAPSKQVATGKLVIYLYTLEDLEELKQYMNGETHND